MYLCALFVRSSAVWVQKTLLQRAVAPSDTIKMY